MVAIPLALPIASAGITGARVAGPYIANLARKYGPMAMKGLINLMSKKDDEKKTITIDEEGNILPDLPDQMPDPDDDDKKPKKNYGKPFAGGPNIEEGVRTLIDASIDKLEKKYKEIGQKRKFDLYQADPSTLDDSLKNEDETVTVTNQILKLHNDKRKKYDSFLPTILKLHNENPDISLNK